MTVRALRGYPSSTRTPGAAALGMMAVVAFFFAGGGRPWLGVVYPASSPGDELEGLAIGEIRALTLVTAGDGGVYTSLPC